jgi:hypothetical protein
VDYLIAVRQQPNKGDGVANYRVESGGQGEYTDRDGYWFRVRYWRDDMYLGVAVGVVDGKMLMAIPPGGSPSRYYGDPFVAVGRRLRILAEGNELPAIWQLDAVQVGLTRSDFPGEDEDIPFRLSDWTDGDVVAEFDA